MGITAQSARERSAMSGKSESSAEINCNCPSAGNCKQNDLAVFDPLTIAAIQHYYPENQDSPGFLYIVYVCWAISNSKVQFNSRNKLGNAVFEGDGYADFLRCFTDWLENWQNKKSPIAKNFTFSTPRKAL